MKISCRQFMMIIDKNSTVKHWSELIFRRKSNKKTPERHLRRINGDFKKEKRKILMINETMR